MNDSLEGLQWISPELGSFYRRYAANFKRVPKFMRVPFNAAEASRQQIGNGPSADYPLGLVLTQDGTIKTTMRPGIGFDIQNDWLVWFFLKQYEEANPLVVSATIVPANPKGIVTSVRSLMASGLPDDKIYEELRKTVCGQNPPRPPQFAG
jgi:hypothetical protein